MNKPLSPKEQRFVEEYLIDSNGAQAAIRAGYARRSAKVTASRLLTKANLKAALATRRAAITESVEISQEMVLEGLLQEARAYGEGCSHGARVAAWTQLGKHLGMFEKDNTQRSPSLIAQLPRDQQKLLAQALREMIAQNNGVASDANT